MSASTTATFVFTDLVDSTATASRLGPEAADALRQTHFRLLRGAVTASGGTEVKNLGDGLMVMYSSASRALACAVGMQQAIEHHNRSEDEQLAVRIGVSAGEVTEEDGDYFGEPVVEAARLCAAASGGQILAAEIVRLMVGRGASQTFVDVGLLDLKGLAGPVAAVEVVWEPVVVRGSVPLPGRLVGAAADALFGFFGRAPEVAVLDDARKRAHAARRAQLVLVAGEAGMGKTALVAKMARTAHAEGSIVLFGHADEDLGVAYQPWVEAVSTLVAQGDPGLVDGLRPAQRTALGRLLPDISIGGEAVADADMERLLLFEGAIALLCEASRRAPLVVVLDDLHWADSASLQLLRHVVVSAVEMDVTVVCTYRDTDLRRGDAMTKLLSDLHREGNVTRVPLAGLVDDELIELLEAAAGHELDERGLALAHALRRETDGNPFFTGEILRHLGESGGIAMGDDGRWTVAGELDELGLPTSVRDVVGRRVERLGEASARVLALAAVIGREFDVDLLARVADIDEDSLLDLLDAAVAAAVLVESAAANRYRFAHALIQHSLYDELSATRRQRTHQRIAEALETETAAEDATTLAELARHWVAATRPADLDKALRYVRRAGDAARDALAPEDAIRWYQQALELLDRQSAPDQRERAELLAALGSEQHRAARPEFRDTLAAAGALAKQLGASDLLVEVALALCESGATVGHEDAKRAALDALEAMPDGDTPQRALLLAAYAASHDNSLEWQAKREAALAALELARRTGDTAAFVAVHYGNFESVATPERRADLIRDAALVAHAVEGVSDLSLRWRGVYPSVLTGYRAADIVAVDAAIAELGALADQLGLPYHRWQHSLFVAGRLLSAGRVDDAEAANEAALEIGTAVGSAEALAAFGGLLYVIRLHQGRVEEIIDFFMDAAREHPSIAVLRANIPAALCEVGRTDEARQLLAADAATGFEFPYDGMQWLLAMQHFADSAASVGDQASGRRLLDLIGAYEDDVAVPGVFMEGAIARPLGRLATLVGDHDRAEAWFTKAHDIHARLQAPYWLALGQLDHADLCLTRGEPGRARELAHTAAGIAARYGCGGLSRRAAAMLEGG